MKRYEMVQFGDEEFKIQTLIYNPKSEVHKNTVIIFPPTGGVNFLDRSYAKKLQKKGAKVILMSSWTGDDEKLLDLGLHQRLHSRAMRALEVVLESIPEDQNISLLGASLGGIYTSIAVQLFDRINKAFIIGAGAPIPEVIATSNNKGMEWLRAERNKTMAFKSEDDYADAIHQVFKLDPLDLPKRHTKKDLAMMVLLDDESVPTKNQLRLKEHWDPSLYIEMQHGHVWGIVQTWWRHSDQVTDFLVQ